jgi:ABC-2 type transport system permease protein
MNTMGATLGDVTTELRVLWIQAAFYFGMACLVYGHQLRESRRHAVESLSAVADE